MNIKKSGLPIISVFISALFFVSIFSAESYASIGVGMAAGKIIIEEKLAPGGIYTLPIISVLNTGDETSDYEMTIEYHEYQEEMRPDSEWVRYNPSTFTLEPKGVMPIEISLALPVKTVPGKYFAYLEAHPTRGVVSGETSVGIAAATKLYFEVKPASFIEGVWYRMIAFWNTNQPWTNIAAGVAAGLVVLNFLKKNLNIQVSVAKKDDKNDA